MQMIFIFRFDLLLGQSTCSSLPQFCLQMGGTCAAYIILQSSMQTSGHLEFFNSSFYLQILVLSSCGHFISLTAGQYFALMVQHQHSTTLWQRYLLNFLHDIKAPIFRTSYLIGCGFNSLAMMSACCLLFILLSLTTFWFLAQHHILTLIFMMAVIMVIGVFVRVCMCLIGIQVNSVDTINVYPRKRSLQSVTEKIGEKQNILYYLFLFIML